MRPTFDFSDCSVTSKECSLFCYTYTLLSLLHEDHIDIVNTGGVCLEECYSPLDSLHITQLHLPSFERRGRFSFLSEGRQISKGDTSIRRSRVECDWKRYGRLLECCGSN